MVIDLQSIEKKLDKALNDPNFVDDFLEGIRRERAGCCGS